MFNVAGSSLLCVCFLPLPPGSTLMLADFGVINRLMMSCNIITLFFACWSTGMRSPSDNMVARALSVEGPFMCPLETREGKCNSLSG